MNILDIILPQEVLIGFQQKIEALLDVSQWTLENRDEKIREAQKVLEQIAEEATRPTLEYLQTDIEGKPLLYYTVVASLMTYMYEHFGHRIRSEMDSLTYEEISEQPVDYDWINSVSRDLLGRLTGMNELLLKAQKTSNIVEAEDL